MARETDTSKIENGVRSFIKEQEWDADEMRQYYFTGYEKIQKLSKANNLYAYYYIYLLPIGPKGEIGEELTLGAFPSQAGAIKGIEVYQQVNITKRVTPVEGKQFDQVDYEIVGVKDFLKEDLRPEPIKYPEVKIPTPPQADPGQQTSIAEAEEINIDDIPF